MKVAVIGLGSMGSRRIRLIKQIDSSIEVVGVDTNTERCQKARQNYGIETKSSIEAVDSDVQCAFVCTAPLSHANVIWECINRKWHVFTELNLVADMYEENMALAEKNGCELFLSSTFIYREEIQYIKSKVQKCEDKLNYMYHVGQYLPDWHPWESYKDFFVGNKRTNGCREIMAIELPWITSLFGEVEQVNVLASKNSQLDIDYKDNYLIQIMHKSGHKGLLAVDVVSRKAVRNLEVFGENLYLSWDGSATGLKNYDFEKKAEYNVDLYHQVEHVDGYASFVVENAYKNEIQDFLHQVKTGEKAVYGFADDLKILRLIDQIEG